ncbi:DNA annealing helicase and endonuclease ZRANB3 isoform X2 [Narcine bancroftii]|uniref:DNA annealing helicase and endonuclease ZRANB3 isoform X2 n=1 Tax=Narcine bancroftii TaxID=1343680 RepID=UPI00383228FB
MEKVPNLPQSAPSSFLKKDCSEDDFETLLSKLPQKLNQKLLPFQKEGVKFAIERNGRCMIADEMGLGKTIQAIATSYFYKKEWPMLIVVPSSLRYPWIEELEKWITDLNPYDVNLIESKNDIGRIPASKVTILGYGLLTRDAQTLINALYDQNFQVVIVDESHYIKSRNAARSTILMPIIQKATRAVLLTGTPALGRPEELFMQINALYPGKFGTWIEFAKKYCNAHLRYFGKRAQWDCKGASNLDELHQRLSNIMIRRKKDEVLTQLPPKIRQQIQFELSKDAAKEMSDSIEEWEKLMRNLHSKSAETDNSFIKVTELITRMHKQTAIAKAGAVKDYIKMMLQDDKLKFLVFAHHLIMLQACTEAVIETKVQYIRIDGSVPSSERIRFVNQFQNDPKVKVAILSIQAAGQGLTFTAATHVVFAELYWDPGHLLQAEDRAHRIGQCSSVHVHYLIAKGTLDSFMWSMLKRKTCVTTNVLNGIRQQLEVNKGDKEKWDFLSTALAWVPNENLRETHDEVFFNHFEKEKQHDIRSFFSSKSGSAEKLRTTPKDLHSQQCPDIVELEEFPNSHELFHQPQKKMDEDKCKMNNLGPQTKRFKSSHGELQTCSSTKKRQRKIGTVPSPLSLERTQQLLSERKLSRSGKTWNCTICTYTNNTFLSYCEMCETCRDVGNQKEHVSYQTNPSEDECQAGTHQTECTVLSDLENGERSELHIPAEQINCEMNHRSTVKSEETLASFNIDKSSKVITMSKESLNNEYQQRPGAVQHDTTRDGPDYDDFMFFASKHTDRIHLYTKLLRFVGEWRQLSAMKQRIIRKSGHIFHSPVLELETIMKDQHKQSCTKRYITKEDVALQSLSKTRREGGSLRIIARETTLHVKNNIKSSNQKTEENVPNHTNGSIVSKICTNTSPLSLTNEESDISLEMGYVQAVNKDGNPLCLSCQQLTIQVSSHHESTAWDTRFCSHKCQEDFLIRSNRGYMKSKVFEAERGICQQCGLNAQQLYLNVRDAAKTHRKGLLENTCLSQLPLDQLNEMILNPTEGQFWQVDHITPVYGGGGQCSLENLQTLCTVCHKARTAKQAKERSKAKRLTETLKYGSDIRSFFMKNK